MTTIPRSPNPGGPAVRASRLLDAPIITPATDPSIGTNINGPSLIRVPDWVESPLGRYYLYFADHYGSYIRLAYADDLLGPWNVHIPGSLHLSQSAFPKEIPRGLTSHDLGNLRALGQEVRLFPVTPHVASPDVHVDESRREIVMYFHGLERFSDYRQSTDVAVSADGVQFAPVGGHVPAAYLRAFRYRDMTYALTMPGRVYRSANGRSGFEPGPMLFGPAMRHSAVLRRDDTLHVFWTRVGDAPEAILHSTITISDDWMSWNEETHGVVLAPEREWEGADLPVERSQRGYIEKPANQLRDPAVFEENGRAFLLYCVAGESGIAIAEISGL
jgi:hypothetical protein